MSLDKIIEKIEQDTSAKMEQILSTARERAALIVKNVQEEADAYFKQRVVAAHRQAKELSDRGKASLSMELRQLELAKKQAVVEDVFHEVERRILQKNDKSYFEFFKKLLIAAAETGTEEIIVSPKDIRRIPTNLLQEVNAELHAQGKKGELRLSLNTRAIKGGFILWQEYVEVNYSLEAILQRMRQEKEQEVALLLFGPAKEK